MQTSNGFQDMGCSNSSSKKFSGVPPFAGATNAGRATRWTSGWLLPAVPEAGVVFDLVEGQVDGPKLVSDTLDCGPHIRPIALSPGSCDETLIVQPVVDFTVSHIPTHVRGQQVDDVVFAEGEV